MKENLRGRLRPIAVGLAIAAVAGAIYVAEKTTDPEYFYRNNANPAPKNGAVEQLKREYEGIQASPIFTRHP
ncbi:hypothetical protein M1615_00690 [Patescibacteria group bacterium]|nr:hypothetical protein [Patescibacteria group bacterium]